ncbi:MAG: NAD(P)H-binding protein [Bacteroidales bacterium]|nr:NAD(P)H-binding protein [Bacteroidales bacterium]
MKAIIIGATGLTGEKILKQLIEHPGVDEVRTFQRVDSAYNHPKLKVFKTDLIDIDSIKEQITGDVLFNAMGTIIKKAGSKKEQQRVDRDIPIAFAKVASQNGVKLMLNVSSIGASMTGGFYLKTKAQMEEGTSSAMNGRVIHFRPSILLGKRRESDFRMAEKISSIVMKIVSPLLIGSLSKYRGMDTDILAKAMVNTSLSRENFQKIFYYNDIVKISNPG